MQSDRIVSLTLSPTIDKAADVGNVVPERKLRCGPPRFEPGGGAVNVSRAIKILGGESLLITTKGGAHGELLQALLRADAITYRAFTTEGWTRENLSVYEESTGLQYRFVMPGPSLEEREWQELLNFFLEEPGGGYLVASGSLPPGVPDDFYARLARAVKPKGTKVIIDTSGPALRQAVSAGVFLIKPNFAELQELADHAIPPGELEQFAKQIVESGGSKVVIVSLGAAGALLLTDEGVERVRAPTVPIKSKVGAGDSMVAGITLSLSRGRSISHAVVFGVAAGASAVMTPGTELCRRDDTERLFEQMMG